MNLHNEFIIFYSSQTITGMIKSMRMKCIEHVQHMGELRDAFKILVRKPARKTPLQRPKNR
jgi:hypothetical protein